MQNIQEVFTYQFQDKDWVTKFLLGSLMIFSCIFIIPIPLLVGYTIRNMRQVAKGDKILPGFEKLGEMYIDGLKFMVYCLGYVLPPFILMFAMIFGAIIIGLISGGDDDILSMLLLFPSMLMQGVFMLYGLMMSLLYPVLYIKYAKGESWKKMYAFKELYHFIKINFVEIVIVIAIGMVGGIIVNAGMLIFFIGILPAAFYAMTMTGYLYGRLQVEAKQ